MNRIIYFILLGVFLLTACNKEKKTVDEEIPVFSEKIAKVVSNVTVGNIKSTQPIEINFIDKVVEYEAINKDLGSDIIALEPSIEGTLVWSSNRTLTFKPKDRWDLRQRYAVRVDLNKLSQSFMENDLGELKFGFYVEGREIAGFSADTKLKQRNDPRKVIYYGRIVFTEAADEETVKKSISLKQGMKDYAVKLIPEGDGVSF
jgi:hypothetical protein